MTSLCVCVQYIFLTRRIRGNYLQLPLLNIHFSICNPNPNIQINQVIHSKWRHIDKSFLKLASN